VALAPYDLLLRPDKTTLTVPGGIALGFGPGPGLRQAFFWNRAGSLFSCYRPAVAVATLFETQDLNHPAPLRHRASNWEPNLCTSTYTGASLRVEERRWALASGLVCEQVLTNTGAKAAGWVMTYHGQAQQWEFFDYARGEREPQIEVTIEPERSCATLRQPHPHDGLPPMASLQEVSIDRELAAYGFAQSESELHALWRDHGCLASLRLRLGQAGARLADHAPASFSHRAPLYYFAVRVKLKPGESTTLRLTTHYRTDDDGGALPDPARTTTPDEWRHYLEREVPQLECSDEALTRYWYYVWYVLRANRTAPGAHITAPFTAPSKYMYWGPWIWDGYFHALGEMWLADAQTAADTIRAVLQMQFPNGFIPVCSGSQYRMCFHENEPGYSAPGGGGYASYLPPRFKGAWRAQLAPGTPPPPAIASSARGEDEAAEPQLIERAGVAVDTHGVFTIFPKPSADWLEGSYNPVARETLIRSGLIVNLGKWEPLNVELLVYIIRLLKRLRADGIPLAVCAPPEVAQQVQVAITVEQYVPCCTTQAEAVAAVLAQRRPSDPRQAETEGLLANYRERAHPFEAELDYLQPAPGAPNVGRRERELPRLPQCMPLPASPFISNEKTQTPLITVAAAEYARLRGGRVFASEVLPALWAYEEWLWRRRTDAQGRFLLWHGDESGWDNATRHYPVPALPFDVQVHCLLHRLALSELAALAGTPQQLNVLRERIKLTRAALKTYWDEDDRWHYDSGSADGGQTFTRRKQIAASGLFALLADHDQPTVDACLAALRDPRVFATPFPIPTLAAGDPDYAPHGWGWNGPAWLQVNFFTLLGLLDARQYEAAFALWEQTRALIIKDGQPAGFELYDPELGTGLGCPDYSWQAMINYLIITRFAGVAPGSAHLAPALPPSLGSLRLSNLPGLVSAVELLRMGRQLKLKVQYAAPLLLSLDVAGLGRVEQLLIDDVRALQGADGRWELPAGLGARRAWEATIICR
jgi:hypothetical protein